MNKLNIQEAIQIAYEQNKWIKRKGETCKIKPTNNDYECCLIAPSENYPKTKKKPSRYWNPKYIDLVSDDWEVEEIEKEEKSTATDLGEIINYCTDEVKKVINKYNLSMEVIEVIVKEVKENLYKTGMNFKY